MSLEVPKKLIVVNVDPSIVLIYIIYYIQTKNIIILKLAYQTKENNVINCYCYFEFQFCA